MAQRAVLAMALSCRPDVLIADEPTTGLDATLQQQVLELVVEQVAARQGSLLLITHDIGIVGRTCEWIAVMYAGRVMERGLTAEVLTEPSNPYTVELVKAYSTVGHSRMSAIPGTVPTLVGPLGSCPFAERCASSGPECHDGVPELRRIGERQLGERWVACVKA
jgi:oligopeptide/dipeptide ABC transporter ATP-binding protein